MSLSTCVAGLLAEGRLAKGQAEEAERIYTRRFHALKGQMGMMAAAQAASEQTLAALRAQVTRRRYVAGLAVAKRQELASELGRWGGGAAGGPIDPRAGPALLAGDDRAPYANVDGRMRAVRARAHGMIDGILARHSANLLGRVRDRAGLDDLVRELFSPGSTGNTAAREMADAWSQAAEMLRLRFNAAGGDIGKLENWGLPQFHDPELVRAAGYEAWRAEILPRLDRAKMIDETTGAPFADEDLETALEDVFQTVRSDGWSQREAGGVGQGALANRRGEGRFLVFRSADDWMAYADRFGAASPFDAMMGHIDGMARDVALLEVLGPNPDATLRWVKDTIAKQAATGMEPGNEGMQAAFRAGKKIDRLYTELTGAGHRPENRKLALTFSAVRSLQTAAKLGGALLSAVTDLGYGMTTRKLNGMPAAKMLPGYIKLFRPGSIEDQRLAVRLGLIADEWSNRTAAQGRYMGEELTGEVSRRLAEGVLRASGLMRWTQAGRWAHGMQVLGAITEERGKAFAELDPGFAGMFERHGIGAAEWDAIRATPLEEDRGVGWIKPANVADQALGDRLLAMLAREANFAVPTADLETRALINSVAPRGTWHGEVIKSAFLFKSFGISVLLQHGRRTMALTGANRLRYAAGLVISTTTMGALALILKDLAAGRDPREADNAGFWGQALIQGGGFGIFGDFLKSSQSRAGGGLAGALAGPVIGDIAALAAIPGASNPEGAALKFLRSQIPGGTLWYARTAFDRAIADQVQEEIDPHYRQSWRRMERWAEEQGTQYWWAPGETMPARAPDLSNITGGQEP